MISALPATSLDFESLKVMTARPSWSLYFHVPFCSFACHYCDFVKTSRFDSNLTTKYFAALDRHTQYWLGNQNVGSGSIESIFFGGGTPGLFTHEYESILARLKEFSVPGVEISLEANPNDISKESLQIWRKLGFNRISIGIQSTSDRGLKFLTRDHNVSQATEAVRLALTFFENVNVDFIYGWPDQSMAEWEKDLEFVVQNKVPHVSLYNLTYEAQTPIGRAQKAGKISSMQADEEFERYDRACVFLGEHGFAQEEVSNWTKPGFSCIQNHRYWRSDYYIGVGVGAHGFIPNDSGIGLRYAYDSHIERFCADAEPKIVIDERNRQSWLMEYVSCRMRTTEGLNVKKINDEFDKSLNLDNEILRDALMEGRLVLRDNHLSLRPDELFREQAWTLKILENIKL